MSAGTKAKDDKKAKKSFTGFLLKLAVVGATVYLVVTFISGQVKMAAKQRELEEITAKVEQQAETNQELLRLIESDNESDYIERMAREKLQFSRARERVFIDLTGQ